MAFPRGYSATGNEENKQANRGGAALFYRLPVTLEQPARGETVVSSARNNCFISMKQKFLLHETDVSPWGEARNDLRKYGCLL